MKLEVCCYGAESAAIAAKNGADRIELCSARAEGGLTPSYGELQLALKLNIPVYPILRPRGGDFCYTAYELEVMKADLVMIRELGFRGVVFGMLTTNGDIDTSAMAELMSIAAKPASSTAKPASSIAKPASSIVGMEVTCHRAFDMSRDPFTSYESLKQLGVARILSSGMQATAIAGLPLLKELNALEGPIVMAGGGVRPDNIHSFIDAGLQELHTSAGKAFASPMQYRNAAVSMGAADRDEYERFGVDIEALAFMKSKICEARKN